MSPPANGSGTTGGMNRELRAGYLAIAVGPVAVFLISQALLQAFDPFDVVPPRIAEFDVHKEGAARLGTLAGLFLFSAAAIGATLFFFYTARVLQRRGRAMVAAAFVLLVGLGVGVLELTATHDPHDLAGRSLFCLAVGFDEAQSRAARKAERDEAKALLARQRAAAGGGTAPEQASQRIGTQAAEPTLDPGVAVERIASARSCLTDRFRTMERLLWWQALLMILAISGLVLGAICCVALPADPDTADMLKHWEEQSDWLNTYLYLSAVLLGCGLLFINAFLLWPSYLLVQSDPFKAHAGALVAYYGFSYTVMLASFYIPVATLLSRRVKPLKLAAAAAGTPPNASSSTLPNAFKGAGQVLKIIFALFSTTIGGIFTGLLDLAL